MEFVAIAVLIAGLIAVVFSLSSSNRRLQQQVSSSLVEDGTLEKMVRDRMKQGDDRVRLVKFVRVETGLGLVEATKYVDRIMQTKDPEQ